MLWADTHSNSTILKTHEDNYISITSIPPNYVLSSDQSKLLGVSIETAIINVLKEIEVSQYYIYIYIIFIFINIVFYLIFILGNVKIK